MTQMNGSASHASGISTSETKAALQKLQPTVTDFLKQVEAKNTQKAASLLTQLKIATISLNLLPPFGDIDQSTLQDQLVLIRSMLEGAVLLSAQQQSTETFERHVQQLKPYYFDYANLYPSRPSARKSELLGLWLLYLLSQNQIADFHCELELIATNATSAHKALPNAQKQSSSKQPTANGKVRLDAPLTDDKYINFSLQLEQQLMEGAYNKILQASQRLPSPSYEHFMSNLIHTVQNKIAECAESAYESFPSKDVSKMLMLKNDKELKAFVEQVSDARRIQLSLVMAVVCECCTDLQLSCCFDDNSAAGR